MLINGHFFELPVIVYSVIWLGAIERKTLTRYAALFDPGNRDHRGNYYPDRDPVNLAFTAVPMYLLYELGCSWHSSHPASVRHCRASSLVSAFYQPPQIAISRAP